MTGRNSESIENAFSPIVKSVLRSLNWILGVLLGELRIQQRIDRESEVLYITTRFSWILKSRLNGEFPWN